MDTDSFKVLLIATNQEKQPYPVYPLGAAMVSQALEADGVTVRGLDCTVVDDPVAAALEASRDFTPDLVAVSIRAVDNTCLLSPRFYIPEAAMVTAALRSTFGFPLLLGGSGFSLFRNASWRSSMLTTGWLARADNRRRTGARAPCGQEPWARTRSHQAR